MQSGTILKSDTYRSISITEPVSAVSGKKKKYMCAEIFIPSEPKFRDKDMNVDDVLARVALM